MKPCIPVEFSLMCLNILFLLEGFCLAGVSTKCLLCTWDLFEGNLEHKVHSALVEKNCKESHRYLLRT